MLYSASMSRQKKRTRIVAKREAGSHLVIKEHHEVKNGKGYASFIVQGWKENGKWKRKQFKERSDAERFVALKRVELENTGRKLDMVLSPLSEAKTQEAVSAFDALGEAYTLKQAVEYFLKNHRPPEYTIKFDDAVKHYIDDKEQDGVRPRTISQVKSVLKAFSAVTENPFIHEITKQSVESYLRGLKSRDGKRKAKRKTWNSHRNELSQLLDWSNIEDLTTHRPWRFNNPVKGIRLYSAKKVAEQRPPVATTSPEQAQHILSVLMRYRGGSLVKAFALAYFAGIRPDGELGKLAERENELINLKTGVISIPAEISKTKDPRQVHISDNLKQWLEAYKDQPIVPTSYISTKAKARQHFKLKHDETRHSFISYHVAIHRSVGDVALQAGNSESMVKKHYLNLHHRDEGDYFFSLIPDTSCRKCVRMSKRDEKNTKNLRVI
jgi:hypothetical protein